MSCDLQCNHTHVTQLFYYGYSSFLGRLCQQLRKDIEETYKLNYVTHTSYFQLLISYVYVKVQVIKEEYYESYEIF